MSSAATESPPIKAGTKPAKAAHEPAAPACKVVLAQTVAKALLTEVHDALKQLGRTPVLVGFLANHDPAARMYADWTAKTCKEKSVRPLCLDHYRIMLR